jgi:hypothetical protein
MEEEAFRARKKPVEVDIIRWTGTNQVQIQNFFGDIYPGFGQGNVFFYAFDDEVTAEPGDYIIKGVEGEFYPCKPSVYQKTYERV